jgi:hypothetical protein
MEAVNPFESEVPIDICLLNNTAEDGNFEFCVSHFPVQRWTFFFRRVMKPSNLENLLNR